MSNSAVEMFEKLATNAHHRVVLNGVTKNQTAEVQAAIQQNDNRALKSLFCNPLELADKTTVFLS